MLAVFVKRYYSNLYLIKNQKGIENEIDFTPDVFNDIELRPVDYTLNYFEFSASQKKYIEEIRKFLILYVRDIGYDNNPSVSLMNAFREYLHAKPVLLLIENGVDYKHKSEMLSLMKRITSKTPRHFWFHIIPEIFKPPFFVGPWERYINFFICISF